MKDASEYALGSKITNRQLAENNLGASLVDSLQLVKDDLPLGIDDGLVFGDLLHTNLRIILLALQLQLDIQTHNLGVLEVLGLLLETGVGESLLESHTVDEKGVLETTTGHLLHTNQLLVQIILIQSKNRIDDHCKRNT